MKLGHIGPIPALVWWHSWVGGRNKVFFLTQPELGMVSLEPKRR